MFLFSFCVLFRFDIFSSVEVQLDGMKILRLDLNLSYLAVCGISFVTVY